MNLCNMAAKTTTDSEITKESYKNATEQCDCHSDLFNLLIPKPDYRRNCCENLLCNKNEKNSSKFDVFSVSLAKKKARYRSMATVAIVRTEVPPMKGDFLPYVIAITQ